MKKIFSSNKVLIVPILLLILILISILSGLLILRKAKPSEVSNSLTIDSNSVGWNKSKADYLAKRVYLDPTLHDLSTLENASSASDAINIIFSSPSSEDIQNYNIGLANIVQKQNTYKNDVEFQNTYYTYQLIHDPNKVQKKLYYLWENIFAVDASEKDDGITYDDVKKLDDYLSTNATGNYIQMVEYVRNNYSMDEYLNLIGLDKNNPNENFARELMQLFLMGAYSPLDRTNSSSNYSDQDVNSLAFILTGYEVNKKDHSVFFNNNQHNSILKSFLGENINDPIHILDYIVKKKRNEISIFLANKILHYYLSDNPADQDLQNFSKVISDNNFEILPSLKYLFASDMMFQSKYMNEDRYRSPVELVSSFYTYLYGRNQYSVIPSAAILTDLGFEPYKPGSIFGRDGFNSNILFYSGSVIDKWIGDSDKIIHQQDSEKIINNILGNKNFSSSKDLISELSTNLYFNNNISPVIQEILNKYMSLDSVGKTVLFSYNDSKYKSTKVIGLISLMLTQPEFLNLNSNISQSTSTDGISQTDSTLVKNKLIVVRLRGGIDYQGLIANTSDPAYAKNRQSQLLDYTNSTNIGNGYVLNNAANSLVPLINQKQAFFISAAGLPNQSRAHDIASKQMETGLDPAQKGILANLSQTNKDISLISFTNTPPIMYKGAPSLEIGSSNLTLYPVLNLQNSDIKLRETFLKNILNTRDYPTSLGIFYKQSILLDDLATKNIQSGGKGTPGSTITQQLPFLSNLLSQNVGNTYYMYADGSYDNHANENKTFNPQVKGLFDNLTTFYNNEKSKYNLTVVVFSEFGRTNKINGNNGTDHGIGGGMIVLSNSIKLPTMVGTLNPSQDQNNWTTVQVDERDVWSNIFNQLYNIPKDKLFGRNIDILSYPVGVK